MKRVNAPELNRREFMGLGSLAGAAAAFPGVQLDSLAAPEAPRGAPASYGLSR